MATKSPYQSSNRVVIQDGTSPSTVLFTFDKNITEGVSAHPNSGACVFTMASKIRSEELETLWASYRGEVSTIDATVDTYSDGTTDTLVGVSSSVPKIISHHVDGVLNGKVRITSILGAFTGGTGGFSTAAGSQGDTPIEITGLKNTSASAITITGTDLMEALADIIPGTIDDIVIAAGSVGTVTYVSTAA